MDGIVVDRQERKPDVVGLRDRSTDGMPIDVAHLKVFLCSTLPSLLQRHGIVALHGPRWTPQTTVLLESVPDSPWSFQAAAVPQDRCASGTRALWQ